MSDVTVGPAPGAVGAPTDRRLRTPVRVAVLFAIGMLVAAVPGWFHGSTVQVTADSGAYLATAQNLAEGRGVTTPFPVETTSYSLEEQLAFDRRVPFTEWPPLYPAALGTLMATGAEAVEAARLLNLVAMATTVLVAACIARRVCGGRVAPGVAAVGLVLLGPVASTNDPLPGANALGQSLLALSETLYLPLFLGALLLSTRRARVAGPVLVAAATLTRFVGVSAGVGAAGALALRPDRREHLGRVLTSAASGPAALVVWSVLRSLWWGSGPGEVVVWHPPTAAQLHDLLDVAGAWFLLPPSLPWPLRAAIVGAALVALVTVTFSAGWRVRIAGPDLAIGRPAGDLLSALVIAALAHLLIVGVTVTLLDVRVPFSQRTSGPAQAALSLAVVGIATGWVHQRVGAGRRVVAVVSAAAVALACLPGLLWLVAVRDEPAIGGPRSSASAPSGRAETGLPAEPPSPITSTRLVPEVPDDMVVVTNVPDLLWFHTSAQLLLAPRPRDPLTGRTNPDLAAQAEQVGKVLASRDGIVVVHDTRSDGMAVRDQLLAHGDLVSLGPCGTRGEVLAATASAPRIQRRLGC